MATARSTDPRLEIIIGVDEQASEAEQRRFLERMRLVAAGEEVKTQKEVTRVKDKGAAEREQAELRHQQKLDQMKQTMAKRWELQDERNRARLLAGHTTWSQRMVALNERIAKSTESMSHALLSRGGGSISGFMQLAIRNSSALVDMAAAIGLNSGQMEELSIGAGKAGIPVQRLSQLLLAFQNATISPTERQLDIIQKIGLTPENLTAVKLLDAAIVGLRNNTLSIADATELTGTRGAYALTALSTSISSSVENTKNAGENIDRLAESEDKYGAALDRLGNLFSRVAGSAIIFGETVWSETQKAFAYSNYGYVEGYENALLGVVAAAEKVRYAVSDMGDSVTNSTEEFLRLTQQDVLGPYIDDATLKTLQAAAASKEWADGVIAEYEAQQKANRERERAAQLIERYLQMQGKSSIGARAMPGKDFSRTAPDALPQPQQTNAYLSQTVELESEFALKIRLVNELLAAQSGKIREAAYVLGQFQGLASSLADLWSVQTQNEINHYQVLMDLENSRWNERSDRMRAAGLESTALYRNEARQQESSQKSMQKRMTQLQAKAWEQEKKAREVQVVMSTAQAVMNALATVQPFFPLGLAMSALATVQGGIQMAAIAGQDNPYKGFATGGIVGGSGFFDNQIVRATQGEAIVDRNTTQRNARALEFMSRGGTVQPGGSFTVYINGPVMGTQEFVDGTLVPAIRKAVRNGHALN